MYDAYSRLGDVNRDGLADIIFSDPYGDNAVYLNNADGTGWTEDAGYTSVPLVFGQTMGGDVRDSGVRVADVNGDGLADLVYGFENAGASSSAVYLNMGSKSWQADTGYNVPANFSLGGYDGGARLADVNSDGLVDIIVADDTYDTNAIYLNDGYGTG